MTCRQKRPVDGVRAGTSPIVRSTLEPSVAQSRSCHQHRPRELDMITTRSIVTAGVATTLGIGLVLAPAASASGGGTAVRSSGSCSSAGTWHLSAKHDDGRIEVEGEVDVEPRRPHVRLDDRRQRHRRQPRQRDHARTQRVVLDQPPHRQPGRHRSRGVPRDADRQLLPGLGQRLSATAAATASTSGRGRVRHRTRGPRRTRSPRRPARAPSGSRRSAAGTGAAGPRDRRPSR